MSFWVLCVVPSLLLAVSWRLLFSSKNSSENPEPQTFPYWVPWLGSAIPFLLDSNGVVERALAHFKSTRPFTLRIAGETIYIFTSAADVKALFRHSKEFTFDPFVEHLLNVVYKPTREDMAAIMKPRYNDGKISILEGTHRFYRRCLLPGPQIERLQVRYSAELDALLGSAALPGGGGTPVDLLDWVRTAMATAATNALLGHGFLRQNPNILDALWKFDAMHMYMVYSLPKFLLKDGPKSKDLLVAEFVRYFREDLPEEDKSPMIWDRRQELENGGLTEDGIAKLTLTIFWAMHTNSTVTAFWLLYYILTTPGLLDILMPEIAAASHNPSASTPLLNSTYFETLRLTSGSASSRVVSQDIHLNGLFYRAGGKVLAPSIQPHLSPEYWGEYVAEFRYDRFLSGEEKGVKFRPFGGGETHCPGRFFAKYEVLRFVVTVLGKWRVAVVDGVNTKVDRNKPAIGILAPRGEVKVVFGKYE